MSTPAADSEDECLDEECRGSVPVSQLSEENLKRLLRGLENLERQGSNRVSSVATTSDRGRNRAPSRQPSSSDLIKTRRQRARRKCQFQTVSTAITFSNIIKFIYFLNLLQMKFNPSYMSSSSAGLPKEQGVESLP